MKNSLRRIGITLYNTQNLPLVPDYQVNLLYQLHPKNNINLKALNTSLRQQRNECHLCTLIFKDTVEATVSGHPRDTLGTPSVGRKRVGNWSWPLTGMSAGRALTVVTFPYYILGVS